MRERRREILRENSLVAQEAQARPSKSECAHPRLCLGVIVKAAAGFPAEHPRRHHSLEKGRWRIALLAVLVEHDLRDLVGRVEPDKIEKGEGSHRMPGSKLHSLVYVFDRCTTCLQSANRIEQ